MANARVHLTLLADVDIWRRIIDGGAIAWAIIGLSIALVALAIALFVSIRFGTQCPEELFLDVEEKVGSSRISTALKTVEDDPSALAVVLEQILRQRQLPRAELLSVAQEAASEQSIRLMQRVNYVGLIASIAPMMGLLGTVSGMIAAFAAMSTAEVAPDAGRLAGAISEALITTYLGLTVAIPALIVYTLLKHRTTNIILSVIAHGDLLVDRLCRMNEAGAATTGRPAIRAR
jgi:biopolymer transport protein ExbB